MAVNCEYNVGQVCGKECGQVCGNECFDIVKSSQTYTVPCTRRVREAYTVQVPKTKAISVNKQEPYIDYETKSKQVPYQYVDRRTVTRSVPTCRTFPIIKSVCTSVPSRRRGLLGRQCYVKKKCPRTVYIRKKVCQPRQFCQSIPRVGWKTVQESVPIQKFRNKTEVQYKTESVPEMRYRTRTVTKMVNKTVPVYNVIAKPPRIGQQQDMLVQTIPATDVPTVLPPLTIQPGPVIAHSSAMTDYSVAAYAPGTFAGAKLDVGTGYSAAAYAPANFVGSKLDGGTSFIDHGVYKNYADGEAVNVNLNAKGIAGNLDRHLSYDRVVLDTMDANKKEYTDIHEYKTYGTQNAEIYGGVANGKGIKVY